MKKAEKKNKIKNFDAEMAEGAGFDGLSTVSSGEATGMMYCPPRSEDELRSREQLFTLQVGMPPEGYVGNEREWRADIGKYYEDEAKKPLHDPLVNPMAMHEVLDPANTFAPAEPPQDAL